MVKRTIRPTKGFGFKEQLGLILIVAFFFGMSNFRRSSLPPPVVVDNDEQHDEVYERGCQLIVPHMQLLGRDPKITTKALNEVERGIRDLHAVTTYNPENWAAFWIKGKGYQVLGDHRAARREFKASFDIQKENPDVAREYASSCLELGYGSEAVRATQHALTLSPDDAGLYANLALAFLIDGKNSEAKQAIDRSLQISPDDKLSQTVQRVVDEVISGQRPQPKNLADINKG